MNFLQNITASASANTPATDVAACPANPEGCAPFVDFHAELAFWGIDSYERQLTYSFANGACAADLAPPLAAELFEALGPDTQLLFQLLEHLEEDYGKRMADESREEPNFHLAHVRAFRAVIDALVRDQEAWLKRVEVKPDRRAWCAFLFCAGVLARQRGALIAGNTVVKFRQFVDRTETYLFTHVVGNKAGLRHFAHEMPMLRFLDSCYPNTPQEAGVMTAIFVATAQRILKTEGNREHNLARYFIEFHSEGLRLARQKPELLQRLIHELDESSGPGWAHGDVRLARQHLGPDPADWTPAIVWRGCRNIIASQQPHLLHPGDSPVRVLLHYAYSQRMIDAAFWTGLIAGRPEAFGEP